MMSSFVSLLKAKTAVLVVGFLLTLSAAAQPPALPAEAPQAPPPPLPLFALNGADEKVFRKYAGGGSYLGVDVTELGTERARALKLAEERGVELTRVAEDSPAAKAGLKAGDVVLEFNGQRVEGTEQFVRLVRETPVGRVVKLLISRGGSSQTVETAIGKRPEMKWSRKDVERDIQRAQKDMERFRVEMPDMPRALMSWRTPVLGIEGESLEGQLAGYFGVESGVLVRSVLKGTPAEKALVKAGDVILKVDDAKVTTPREISSAVRAQNAKKTFPLMVRRNHKDLTLNVTVENTGGERLFAPRRRVAVPEEP